MKSRYSIYSIAIFNLLKKLFLKIEKYYETKNIELPQINVIGLEKFTSLFSNQMI